MRTIVANPKDTHGQNANVTLSTVQTYSTDDERGEKSPRIVDLKVKTGTGAVRLSGEDGSNRLSERYLHNEDEDYTLKVDGEEIWQVDGN